MGSHVETCSDPSTVYQLSLGRVIFGLGVLPRLTGVCGKYFSHSEGGGGHKGFSHTEGVMEKVSTLEKGGELKAI